jgi:hypothetical protein
VSIAPRAEPVPAWWRWAVPLGAAVAVFSGVLLATPPGFASIGDVLFGSVRGPNAEAAAYALGAAAGLALVTLLLVAAGCVVIDLLHRQQ